LAGVRQAIERIGASVLHLPPYRPDLNPIEQLFAKIKAILRTLAARPKDALWHAIRIDLQRCDDDVFDGYLRNCGYGST
jgi:transposase